MGTRQTSILRGLLIPDARLGVDNLAPNDGADAGSSYTEVGSRPGSSSTDDPNPPLRIVVGEEHGHLQCMFQYDPKSFVDTLPDDDEIEVKPILQMPSMFSKNGD